MKVMDEAGMGTIILGEYGDIAMAKQCMNCSGGSSCACGCKSSNGNGSQEIPYTDSLW